VSDTARDHQSEDTHASETDAREADGRDGAGEVDDGLHHLPPPGADGEMSEATRPFDPSDWHRLHRMLDVPLTLTVELGSTEMPLAEVLRLDTGAVVTIDRIPGEPIDLLINGRLFARGEVVVINDTFGYRITELVDDADRTIQFARTGSDPR